MNKDEVREIAIAATRNLTDAGRIIEGGWQGYAIITKLKDTSTVQQAECQKAFYAGAQHLFTSIMCSFDPGEDASTADVSRFHKIADELETFAKQFLSSLSP